MRELRQLLRAIKGRFLFFILLPVVFFPSLVLTSCRMDKIGPPPLKTTTIYGRDIPTLLPPAGHTTHVLFFLSIRCPVSADYMQEIVSISQLYSPAKFAFFLIITDSDVEKSDIQSYMFQHGYHGDAIQDKAHLIIKRYAVTATPEVVVLRHPEQVLYQGRIDDMYISQSAKKTVMEKHDLRLVLDKLASSRKCDPGRTEAIGSRIPAVE